MIVGVAGLALNDFIVWLGTALGWYYLVAKAVAAGTGFAWNFLLRKYLVYR
jgi:putative flippase GtrA